MGRVLENLNKVHHTTWNSREYQLRVGYIQGRSYRCINPVNDIGPT